MTDKQINEQIEIIKTSTAKLLAKGADACRQFLIEAGIIDRGMNEEKEIIEINKAFIDDVLENDLDGFEIVQSIQETYDDDDGNIVDFVLKRNSDGKFFAGYYNYWASDRTFDDYSENLVEVKPREKISIIYD